MQKLKQKARFNFFLITNILAKQQPQIIIIVIIILIDFMVIIKVVFVKYLFGTLV
jgi:hypothetical protein